MKNNIISYLRKFRRLSRIILRKDYFTSIDCYVPKKRFGSENGGWHVAISDIDANSIVLSFGLGEDISFDHDLIDYFDLKVYGFDPTPKSIKWIKSLVLKKNFQFREIGIANFDGTVKFYPPKNPEHVSHTIFSSCSNTDQYIEVPVESIGTISQKLNVHTIDIMKMDIEGAEYDVISNLKITNIRPKQILVEFHHRFLSDGVNKTKLAVYQLRSLGYRLFYVSSNGEEYSFIYDPYKKL